MVKDKKGYNIKDTMSNKISFIHYRKWTRVILPVVFEELGRACIVFATLFFSLSLSIGKKSTLATIRGKGCSRPQPPGFYEPNQLQIRLRDIRMHQS